MPELRDPPFLPVTPARLASGRSVFDVIREGDLLLHHPYDSFQTSVERFLQQATDDPDVLAIKLTLYRTGGDSSIARLLAHAAERGKQVAVLIELQARFDEESNIIWAQRLEDVGVHVSYGVSGLKTHTKVMLVVRREGHGHPPLRAHRHRQLQPADRAALHRLRPLLVRPGPGRGPDRPLQRAHRLRRDGAVPEAAGGAAHHAGALRGDDPPRRRPRARRPAGAHRRQDERPGRPRDDPRALRGLAGGRAGRPDRPRHLLPPARACRG